MPKNTWRQGDIVFKRVSDSVCSLYPSESKADFEAGGETGRSHVVRNVAILAPLEGTSDLAQLEFDSPREVEHEQHNQDAALILPTGTYRVYRVRDANPQRQGE